MELAMGSSDAPSTRDSISVALDPDRKDFSGDFNDLQLTTAGRFNQNTNLGRNDETLILLSKQVICRSVKETLTRKRTLITLTLKTISSTVIF